MSLDLSEIPNDPDLGIELTIIRTPGYSGVGGWQTTTPLSIPAWGIWAVADDEALAQVPEGDRVTGAMQFITATQIFETTLSRSQTSDQINWCGDSYRVQKVGPWKMNGFYSAILVRETGA